MIQTVPLYTNIYYNILYGTLLYLPIVLVTLLYHFTVHIYAVIYCTVLYLPIVLVTLWNYTLLYYTVLYCSVPSNSNGYTPVLLHCTHMYYTILYCTVPSNCIGYTQVLLHCSHMYYLSYCTVLYLPIVLFTLWYHFTGSRTFSKTWNFNNNFFFSLDYIFKNPKTHLFLK